MLMLRSLGVFSFQCGDILSVYRSLVILLVDILAVTNLYVSVLIVEDIQRSVSRDFDRLGAGFTKPLRLTKAGRSN